MPKEHAAERRDKKNFFERYGMQVQGHSLKSVILPLLGKKARNANRDKKKTSNNTNTK